MAEKSARIAPDINDEHRNIGSRILMCVVLFLDARHGWRDVSPGKLPVKSGGDGNHDKKSP